MPRLLGRFALTATIAICLFFGFFYHYSSWKVPLIQPLASDGEKPAPVTGISGAPHPDSTHEALKASTKSFTYTEKFRSTASTPQAQPTTSASANTEHPLDLASIYQDDQQVHQTLHTSNYSNNSIALGYVKESLPTPVSVDATPTKGWYQDWRDAKATIRTKTLVVAKLSEEDTQWIDKHLSDMLMPNGPLHTAIYVVDNPEALLHTPVNKGHEAMAYLTYIIDAYDGLPDVSIFMHSHDATWHNNDLLNLSSAAIVRRLNPERVIREGYMNLRCHWEPGCPDWMHPDEPTWDSQKQEQVVIGEAWKELFPNEPVPHTLSSACCAQFAVSKDSIRETSLERWTEIREWLRTTSISDHDSGRVFEYFWPFLFVGKSQLCPHPRVCYCDGYGVCFENEKQYADYFDVQNGYKKLWDDIGAWRKEHEEWQNGTAAKGAEEPDPMIEVQLWNRILEVDAQLKKLKSTFVEQGRDTMQRAALLNKTWNDVGKDESVWIDLSMTPGEQEALKERRRKEKGKDVEQKG